MLEQQKKDMGKLYYPTEVIHASSPGYLEGWQCLLRFLKRHLCCLVCTQRHQLVMLCIGQQLRLGAQLTRQRLAAATATATTAS
jgi:hypothetical protein